MDNKLEWGESGLSSLGEIRSEIDKIDKEIVVLLCRRGELVKQAASFKPNPANVKDLKRLEQIIEKVTSYAKEMNFDSFTIEKIYRNMIEQFIQLEMKTYSDLRSNSDN
jgi:isochorismate pyruvate lyase